MRIYTWDTLAYNELILLAKRKIKFPFDLKLANLFSILQPEVKIGR